MKKVGILSLMAFICMSGQMARKEVEQIPSTQAVVEENEKQEGVVEEPLRKSAARRSMEPPKETAMNRKSAAKKAMEVEK